MTRGLLATMATTDNIPEVPDEELAQPLIQPYFAADQERESVKDVTLQPFWQNIMNMLQGLGLATKADLFTFLKGKNATPHFNA